MKHGSFDLHFFRNRRGKWCVSATSPSGQRTQSRVLDGADRTYLRHLLGFMVQQCALDDLPCLYNESVEGES